MPKFVCRTRTTFDCRESHRQDIGVNGDSVAEWKQRVLTPENSKFIYTESMVGIIYSKYMRTVSAAATPLSIAVAELESLLFVFLLCHDSFVLT